MCVCVCVCVCYLCEVIKGQIESIDRCEVVNHHSPESYCAARSSQMKSPSQKLPNESSKPKPPFWFKAHFIFIATATSTHCSFIHHRYHAFRSDFDSCDLLSVGAMSCCRRYQSAPPRAAAAPQLRSSSAGNATLSSTHFGVCFRLARPWWYVVTQRNL